MRNIISSKSPSTRVFASFCAVAALLSQVPAQGDTPGSKEEAPPVERRGSFEGLEEAGSLPRSQPEAPRTPAQDPSAAPTSAVEILELSAATPLREVPSKEAPSIGAQLPAGTLLVRLGPDLYGHAPVGLIDGFDGFVHSKFFRDLGDGWGETTGTNVSFRIRPRVGEPPLCALERAGTKLAVRGREGDWVRVVAPPSARAWIENGTFRSAATLPFVQGQLDDARVLLSSLSKHPQLAERLATRIAALEASFAKERAAAKEAAARAAYATEFEGAVVTLLQDFDAVRSKPELSLEELDQLATRGQALQASATAKGLAATVTTSRLETLLAAIAQKRIVAEAKALVKTDLAKPAAADASEAGKVKDAQLDAVAARRTWTQVGWIEYRPGTSDYRPYRLMKGGTTIQYLDCTSGRYDLADFVGREVGLIGVVDRREGADFRILDVERLVILSSSKS